MPAIFITGFVITWLTVIRKTKASPHAFGQREGGNWPLSVQSKRHIFFTGSSYWFRSVHLQDFAIQARIEHVSDVGASPHVLTQCELDFRYPRCSPIINNYSGGGSSGALYSPSSGGADPTLLNGYPAPLDPYRSSRSSPG